RIVREGAAAGTNRSDMFHMVVGHYLGCGWGGEHICEPLKQFPDGIAGRYLGEGRITREILRSAGKYNDRVLPLFDGWKVPEIRVELPETSSQEVGTPELEPPPAAEIPTPDPDKHDEDLDDDLDDLGDKPQQDPKLPPLY